ncbi:hypothetical protein [Nocardioides sp.]|uniref:hypothetical protein n=1 Tax=Nocardioides sp. TaxID=35761 RepID=UPI002735FAEB|nr:hypothetical protein [Nocardioides sp.]MDP3890950.1 hypothetical protein [Nocardioides sp.]
MPSPSAGRRAAPRPPSWWSRVGRRLAGGVPGRVPVPGARLLLVVGAVLVLAGLGCLVSSLLGVGPAWVGDAGVVAVAAVYAATLAGRVGGRPLPVGAAALVTAGVTVWTDNEVLRAGAAVLLTVVAAVLAVMVTVPAVRTLHAVREVVVALLVSAVGAFAAIGFEPTVGLTRFEYVTLGLAFLTMLGFVHRLGAGFHGLGRRGLAIVLVGGLMLAVTLAYAELLRRYGSPGVVDVVFTTVAWMRENLGAVPRPIEVLLGIPALAWGCHMRARRRQGWWVCAFGVAATVPVGHSLMNPDASVLEAVLGQGYSLVLGLVLGYVVIRVDLALTGQRGSRARRAEEAAAVRPEPTRTRPLQ